MSMIVKCGVVVTYVWVLALAGAVQAQPVLTNMTLSANLVAGQDCAVSVSCNACEPGGTIQSVTAGLPGTKGAVSVALSHTGPGDLWTGSGSVTPVPGGVRWVTFTATDAGGTQTLAGVMVLVSEPRISLVGDLVQGAPCPITISYVPAAGPVTLDLSMIGGPASLVLPSNGSWYCSLTVTPVTSGVQNIGFQIGTPPTDGGFTAVQVGASPIGVVRPVQGRSNDITITYTPRGALVAPVVADLSSIVGGSASLDLDDTDEDGTWTGTAGGVTPSAKGLKVVDVRVDGTTAASAVVGVLDPDLLYGDWLFVMWDGTCPQQLLDESDPAYLARWEEYANAMIGGILATHIPVVLLEVRLWDWWTDNRYYDPQASRWMYLDQSQLTYDQVNYLVSTLRANGVTVAFHHCAPGEAGHRPVDLERAWLFGDGTHPGALAKLRQLGTRSPTSTTGSRQVGSRTSRTSATWSASTASCTPATPTPTTSTAPAPSTRENPTAPGSSPTPGPTPIAALAACRRGGLPSSGGWRSAGSASTCPGP